MKKLMFAIAAIAAGAAVADVSSANIVGYHNGGSVWGYCAKGVPFATITGEDFDIQDIKPIAPEGESPNMMFQICEINDGGATAATYMWWTANGTTRLKDGWYNTAGTIWATKTFKKGEGFAFNSDFDPDDEGEGKMQTAGQVHFAEFACDATVWGYQARCNPRPVEIDIQSLDVVPPTGKTKNMMFQICEMNDGAATSTTYMYWTANGTTREKDGWYNTAGTVWATKKFGAGEGFYFNTDYDPDDDEPSALYFPAIDLEK